MKDKVSPRNPLAIISIFVILVESLAALVITQSNLPEYQNTILVIFLVLFPILLLIAFYLLVTRHHTKLYAPSEYKNEDNFTGYSFNWERNRYEKAKSNIRKVKATNVKTVMLESDDSAPKPIARNIPQVDIMQPIDSVAEESVVAVSDTEPDRRYRKSVSVTLNGETAHTLKDELSNLGYFPTLTGEDRTSDEQLSAIWLGAAVPADIAVEVILNAKKYLSHLKYILLSSSLLTLRDFSAKVPPPETHTTIFIGGATSTAEELGLSAFSDSDFECLKNFRHSADDLHRFIERFQ